MADGERDQMLVDFQSCTQIDDLETCIAILEQNNWELVKSIQSVMPQTDCEMSSAGGEPPPYTFSNHIDQTAVSQDFPSEFLPSHNSYSPLMDPGSASGPFPGPSSSYSSGRLINFTVEYRGRNITVNVFDTETVGKIKEVLFSELGIPVQKQDLRGWSTKKVDDKKVLRDLQLPRENTLYLLTPDLNRPLVTSRVTPETDSSKEFENFMRDYVLHITFRENGRAKEYHLNVQGSKTVGEVKGDIYHLTNVPARHQVWIGWPDAANKDDAITLAACGLKSPVHDLELTKANIIGKPQYSVQDTSEIDISDDDDENNDSYAVEEDIFEHEESKNSRKQTPLMPDTVGDQTEALEHFTREFRERYGETHPVFFVGSLEGAIKESLLCRAKDRKLLAVYLHHDNSILSNVFCSQILCMETIVNYLCGNFITWAWDVTQETNNARFISIAKKEFGSIVAAQIRGQKPDQLPLLMIVSRSRASNEVLDMIPGTVTLDELMMRLMQNAENFHLQQQADIKEEDEREARDSIRQEQELAFQESLATDRAKAEAKRQGEEMEQIRQMEEERVKKEEEDRKQAIQESALMHIRDEPPESCEEAVSRIRIRTPNGDNLQRRFYASDKLKYLIYFITSQGFHTEEFKILTTFPRRDVSQLDEEKTLEELKMFPQETLILEERH
ncbi:FAS-associated factor 1-like [Mizuhopecten yessoensis]|nr:FAS-associated factor 1-like [Mizuhopecten yessoensis]